jgi:CRP/FNR family transcriptional activator FtrB
MREFEAGEVRALHLFDAMADEHFNAVIKAAYLQRFPAHVVLITEGDRPDFLHVVLEGSVELFSGLGRHQTTIAMLRPITTFILEAVVGDLPYLASARTLKASRILLIPAETVRSIFEQDTHFAHAIVRELSRAFRGMLMELKNRKLRTSLERLALWMLRADAQSGSNGRFTIAFDKRTIASQLGMTPENLSRNLKILSGFGVEVRGRDVRLNDPARLAAIAKADGPLPQSEDWV